MCVCVGYVCRDRHACESACARISVSVCVYVCGHMCVLRWLTVASGAASAPAAKSEAEVLALAKQSAVRADVARIRLM